MEYLDYMKLESDVVIQAHMDESDDEGTVASGQPGLSIYTRITH